MSKIETIKDFYGKVLGTIEEQNNGDVIVKDFYGRILGRYDKALNVTKDFFGRIIATGNVASSLIFNQK